MATGFLGVLVTYWMLEPQSTSAEAAHRQTVLAQQEQHSQRFARAVEHLGEQAPDRLQTRLGAVHELGQLAHEAPARQPAIIDILSEWIRRTTPRPTHPATCPESVAPDVQAALTVLGERNSAHDGKSRIDLSATCLRRVNLSRGKFENALLNRTDLNRANLTGTRLHGAELREGASVIDAKHDGTTDISDVSGNPVGAWWR
ncbi:MULTISPECIES: pentapeptide repeat-containing protein [unclassified Saccharothrix]|uniref:pentapeptide repeat-containing protein n=1 Tax=unclassified Saccharothrix TaxID=2593673 RepID=UPI00307D4EC9